MKTWDDAVAMWRAERVYRTARWQRDERAFLRWLAPYLEGVPLAAIDAELLQRIKVGRIATGVGPYTVNATLSVVRAVLRAAATWGWVERVPQFRLVKRPPPIVRHITPDQAARLLAALPPHSRLVACFSLETGLRKSNAVGLRWSWVDLSERMVYVPATAAKGRRPISVPLSDRALEILEACRGVHSEYVFTYMGRPIRETNTKAYRAAVRAAGLERFRWHDLRHTWASWHAMSGTPLLALQQLGGWSTVAMVNNYAHLQADGLRPWVKAMSTWSCATWRVPAPRRLRLVPRPAVLRGAEDPAPHAVRPRAG